MLLTPWSYYTWMLCNGHQKYEAPLKKHLHDLPGILSFSARPENVLSYVLQHKLGFSLLDSLRLAWGG